MNREMKDSLIFIVASLVELADMTESPLQEVVELVGVDALQELIGLGHLRYELDYAEMAEEICHYIGWEPTLDTPERRDVDLARVGVLLAEVIDGRSPADEDVAEQLFSFITWEGFDEWLSINDGSGTLL